jgi:hypothetical protein
MKHVKVLSKTGPAGASLLGDHPGLQESICAFLRDPIGTLRLHLKKDQVE